MLLTVTVVIAVLALLASAATFTTPPKVDVKFPVLLLALWALLASLPK